MLTVYLSCFVFGMILILASLVLGDKELDHDADGHVDLDGGAGLDHDHDHDHDSSDASTPLPFLSVRFWTFTLASFGMAGALLVWMGASLPIHLPASAVTGLSIGTLIWWVFQKLKHGATDAPSLTTLQGQEADVLLAVQPGGTGKIRLLVEGRHVDMLATTKDQRPLQRGEKVLVVSVDGLTACVTPISRLLEEPQPDRRRAPSRDPDREGEK